MSAPLQTSWSAASHGESTRVHSGPVSVYVDACSMVACMILHCSICLGPVPIWQEYESTNWGSSRRRKLWQCSIWQVAEHGSAATQLSAAPVIRHAWVAAADLATCTTLPHPVAIYRIPEVWTLDHDQHRPGVSSHICSLFLQVGALVPPHGHPARHEGHHGGPVQRFTGDNHFLSAGISFSRVVLHIPHLFTQVTQPLCRAVSTWSGHRSVSQVIVSRFPVMYFQMEGLEGVPVASLLVPCLCSLMCLALYSLLFFSTRLQMEALQAGLDGTPLVLIQGPPGTGKTRTILNLLSVVMHAAAKGSLELMRVGGWLHNQL
jgi:hypothetical protein